MALDLFKLRKNFIELQDEHAHQCMQTPAADPFNHGIQIGQYRAYSMIVDAIGQAIKDSDPD